jgi:class 3 adenylate cyclase/tetratricopeptide (TPR) repeat protein
MQTPHQLVPEFIYEKYRAGTAYGGFQGAAIFVDLSGFSTMTDALSVHGAHGAEVLANMMRVVFEPLVSAVYGQGGFVVGYAGDAFNAIFPAGQDETLAMLQCLAAAWSMQTHAMSNPVVSTPYGDFPIRIKVGIGYGTTTWQIFKSASGKHASYWFRGQSLAGAVLSEESARAGDVVSDPAAYALLKDAVDAVPAEDCYLINNIRVDLPKPRHLFPPEAEDSLVDLFFAEVTSLPIPGEFRQVVNLFIDIPVGISDKTLIEPFMETVYLLQEQYGGFFLRPDLGDKGFNLLMFWGAPTAYENDVDRALNFILELSTRTGIVLRAGISYRLAYAGFIGASQREDYTAYGWGVNLASRMMERAGAGECWLDGETARRAAKHFNLRPLGEHRFKGFKHQQQAFVLLGRKNLIETVYQGQLVGRDSQLADLSAFVEPLKRGQFAGLLVLKGEAGIGKSRLVHSFQYSAYFEEFPVNWVVCQTDEILRLPFNPLVDWLKKRFGLLEGQSGEVNLIQFLRGLQQLIESTPDAELVSELSRTSSVLAALVNISMPNSLYESLDAKGRYENTLIALSVLLRAESLQKPLIFFLEDTHWLDGDTNSFLSYFVQILTNSEKQYPIAIIATQRPEGESSWAADQIPVREIWLGKLTSSNLSQLAADILSHPVSDSLLALLDARADGNPFFAEQILRYLSEYDALALDADGKYFAAAGAEISLPTDVRSVLVARLDSLTQQVKEMVQTASVLGREFEVRVLGEMLRPDRDFSRHLAQAENANIWSAVSELVYIFSHALLRDAAYSMQLQSRRQELHGITVWVMEVVYQGDLESHYGELAYHAEKAMLSEKALHYLTLAGKLALGLYQNQQAIDYFTRALSVVPDGDLRARFDLLLLRAEGYYNLSNHEDQLKDLSVLEGLASRIKDKKLSARAAMRRAYYFFALAQFQNTLDCALSAKELAESAKEYEVMLALYTLIPSAHLRLGRVSAALKSAKDGIAFARRVNHRQGEGKILTMLGLVSLESEGLSVVAGYHEQALMISRELKDRYLEAMALSNLATVMGTSHGDYLTALAYFEKAYTIACELGNDKGQAITLSNMGWLEGVLGNHAVAINYLKRALIVLQRIGERSSEINIYVNLSAVAGRGGDARNALLWARQALVLSTELGDRGGCAWAYFYLGHAFLLNDQLDEAVQSFVQSMEIRSEISSPVLVIESRAGLIDVYLRMGDQHSANVETKRVLEYRMFNPTFEGAEEPLRIFLTLYQSLGKTKDLRAAIVMQDAIQLLRAQVLKLPLEEARRTYIDNVPWRCMLSLVAKENGLDG